jgi:hypothetical protein
MAKLIDQPRVSLSVYVPICPSVRPSVVPLVRMSVFQSVCPSVRPFVCMYFHICRSVCLSVCVCLSLCLPMPACLLVCLSACLSVCLNRHASDKPSSLLNNRYFYVIDNRIVEACGNSGFLTGSFSMIAKVENSQKLALFITDKKAN